jgi:hypothetical protein
MEINIRDKDNIHSCEYFINNINSNVIIRIIDAEDIKVNREIVSEGSNVLRDLLNSGVTIISIDKNPNIQLSVYKSVIAFLYGCNIKFDISYFGAFYVLANFLDIPKLEDKLIEYAISQLNFINAEYFVTILNSLINLGPTRLNLLIEDFFARNFINLQNVLMNLSLDSLHSIIYRDDLNVNDEYQLVMFLEQWCKLHQNELQNINNEIIPYIRLSTIKNKQLNQSSLMIFPKYRNNHNQDIPRISVVNHILKQENNLPLGMGSTDYDNPPLWYREGQQLPVFTAILIWRSPTPHPFDRNKVFILLQENVNCYAYLDPRVNLNNYDIQEGCLIRVLNSRLEYIEIIKDEIYQWGCVVENFEIIYDKTPTF